MNLPNLNNYERRPDWKEIVESIPCPQIGCAVPAHSPCRNVSSDPFSLLGQMTRPDYHQFRKIMAINKWNMEQGNLTVLDKGTNVA